MSHESGCCLSGNRTGMTNLVTTFSWPDWFTSDLIVICLFVFFFFWLQLSLYICSLVLFYL